ncbi:hypothetical protein [Companilactobacillus nodensis]|uniref:hypothetical protein n=1 Tax=Companilactobacillus nodensis TaxID=460870 RepID=UPI000469D5C4|nr:hypothetical protein [Companilactobacillus nodensis]
MIPMFWTFTMIMVILTLCLKSERYARNVKTYKSDLITVGLAIGITTVICLTFFVASGHTYMLF